MVAATNYYLALGELPANKNTRSGFTFRGHTLEAVTVRNGLPAPPVVGRGRVSLLTIFSVVCSVL